MVMPLNFFYYSIKSLSVSYRAFLKEIREKGQKI